MGKNINHSCRIPTATDTRADTGIWLALVIALGLHALLLLPLTRQLNEKGPGATQIEIQLTVYDAQATAEEAPLPNPLTGPEPAPTPDIKPESLAPEKKPSQAAVTASRTAAAMPVEPDLEPMNTGEKARLTRAILSSQFITEDSAADRLFGKPIERYYKEIQKEFHIPARPSLLAMLDQPMQELPFKYTPGLVRFAYEPGIRGKLQRFGDKITPEFGWITKYGTEVKCVWVLVIAACGWGRPSAMGVSKRR